MKPATRCVQLDKEERFGAVSPPELVPSGKSAKSAPLFKACLISAVARAASVRLSRRTNTVPASLANHPNTGQLRTSCLATNTAGVIAPRTRMSR